MPKLVKSIQILTWIQIIFSVLFISYAVYLAFGQPEGGWTGTGFNIGFLKGLTGQEETPIIFTSEDAGRVSAGPFIILLLAGGMLYAFKKKKLAFIGGLAVLEIIWSFAAKGIPLIPIIIFIFTFLPSVKAYFHKS